MTGRALLALYACTASLFAAGAPVTRYVNIFVGTGGDGHTTPAATVPFGMVQLGPDTDTVGWAHCSGYRFGDPSIMGFTHTHLSGTGVGDMLDVLLMPGTGPAKLIAGRPDKPGEGYRSRFSHDTERAEPGYYSVALSDYGIKAELTATEHAGIHRYTFPKSDSAHFILDLAHIIADENDKATPAWLDAAKIDKRILSASLRLVDDHTIVGERRTTIWATDRHLYFAMQFSKPFGRAQLVDAGQMLPASERQVSGQALKCLLFFHTDANEVISVKVGISAVSIEGAQRNLKTEIPSFAFDEVRARAHRLWEDELSHVQVTDSDQTKKEIFYSALYHTMVAPTLFDDVDGQYRGMDGAVHQLPPGQHNYSTFSLWDTYRAAHSLYTLVEAQRVPDFINSLVRMAEQSPEGPPVWPLSGSETGCMTGYHSAAVIAEACQKGIKGVEYARAYPVLRKRALEDDYRGLALYRRLGYIACDKEAESATKTMEYSYDDWAVARLAQLLGKEDDAAVLLKQAGNYRNLFDHQTGFIRPRTESGAWASPFDPKTTGTSTKWRDFTESNSWQGTWAAQHDVQGTIVLMGGRAAFLNKLDSLFTQTTDVNGEVPVDMAGLVGMYAHGNEPSHHIAYLYDYAGEPYKTQERVRSLLDTMYRDAPDGLAGNEDCGQMSAWYVMSALGFYPVDPVSGNYVFGSPLFDRVTLSLAPGKTLTIETRRASSKDFYVSSVMLNGMPHGAAWFPHHAIANGGSLVFQMSAQPVKSFAADPADAPPSMTAE